MAEADKPKKATRPRALLIVVAVVLVALGVWGVAAVFQDDDTSSPAATTTTAPARPTTTRPGSAPTTVSAAPTTTVPTAPAGTEAVPGSDSSEPGAPAGDAYASDECVLFRQLLELVDTPELRSGAAAVGCI